MESYKNKNLFHTVGAVAAGAALFFSGITYGKYNDAEQLHQAAVLLNHQGGEANKQLAQQAQLYSNQTQPDIKIGLAATIGFSTLALGGFAAAGALSRADRRRALATQAAAAEPAAATPPDELPLQAVPQISAPPEPVAARER